MGDLEIIKLDTGARTVFQTDGSVIKDAVVPPEIDWCDKGQHYATKAGGRYLDEMLWYCGACK